MSSASLAASELEHTGDMRGAAPLSLDPRSGLAATHRDAEVRWSPAASILLMIGLSFALWAALFLIVQQVLGLEYWAR